MDPRDENLRRALIEYGQSAQRGIADPEQVRRLIECARSRPEPFESVFGYPSFFSHPGMSDPLTSLQRIQAQLGYVPRHDPRPSYTTATTSSSSSSTSHLPTLADLNLASLYTPTDVLGESLRQRLALDEAIRRSQESAERQTLEDLIRRIPQSSAQTAALASAWLQSDVQTSPTASQSSAAAAAAVAVGATAQGGSETAAPKDDKGGQNNADADKEEDAVPRRPLTAYNIFFRFERAKVLGLPLDFKIGGVRQDKKRPHRKTHGKIPFVELARHVSKKWKNLEPEKKAHFEALAKEELQIYKKAKASYLKRHEMDDKPSPPS